MTTSNNPFVLPGFGQTGDTAANPLLAGLDMMREAWAGLAGAGGLHSLTQAVPMNLEDMDRRIAELRTVENWLKLNQSMLASTLQSLEVQRATMATLKSFADSAGGAAAGNPANTDAAQQWWNLMQEQFNQLTQAAATSMQGAGATDTAASAAAKKAVKRTAKSANKATNKSTNKSTKKR